MSVNARRVVAWCYRRIVALADAGRLQVRSGGRMVQAVDQDDVDAWLLGLPLPSEVRFREEAPAIYASAGVEIG